MEIVIRRTHNLYFLVGSEVRLFPISREKSESEASIEAVSVPNGPNVGTRDFRLTHLIKGKPERRVPHYR